MCYIIFFIKYLMLFRMIKVLLLAIFGVFRKTFCCWSRRRKSSFSEPMTNVVVDKVNANTNFTERFQTSNKNLERDWNCWDDSPRTVQEHIEQYRQRISKPPTPPSLPNEPDYFKELTPMIKPQFKYYLNNSKQTEDEKFSRLDVKTDVPITFNVELEDWEDDVPNGWEEMDPNEAQLLIRQKRREKRMQRYLKTHHQNIEPTTTEIFRQKSSTSA